MLSLWCYRVVDVVVIVVQSCCCVVIVVESGREWWVLFADNGFGSLFVSFTYLLIHTINN